jgi:glutamine synthetase
LSSTELVALVCCDLGGIVRGRSLMVAELGGTLRAGVGWVPANHSLTPHGPLAARTPFDSTGDLRLLPDPGTHVRVEAESAEAGRHPPPAGIPVSTEAGRHSPSARIPLSASSGRPGERAGGPPDTNANALELVLCDIVETDGTPWECCPRRFLREALEELERELGAKVVASFEHEFQLLSAEGAAAAFSLGPPAAPFSLEAQRRAEPFAAEAIGALVEAGAQPERIFAEFAPHQFEIPVEATEGVGAADRSVVLKEVVREVARRRGLRATFTPLLHPDQPGNGVHIHFNLIDAEGAPLLYDAARPGCLSELGGRFAAGILRHAGALSALCAPSPVSAARLTPHRWSAGAVCVGERNREALLRIPPLVALAAGAITPSPSPNPSPDLAPQLRLEYRGADAAANPYLALGAIVRAGLDGVRAGLAPPPILDRDPARLDAAEAERFGVGALPASLEDALQALAADDTARGWLGATLYEAYVGIKQAELDAVADLDLGEVCKRYAYIY